MAKICRVWPKGFRNVPDQWPNCWIEFKIVGMVAILGPTFESQLYHQSLVYCSLCFCLSVWIRYYTLPSYLVTQFPVWSLALVPIWARIWDIIGPLWSQRWQLSDNIFSLLNWEIIWFSWPGVFKLSVYTSEPTVHYISVPVNYEWFQCFHWPERFIKYFSTHIRNM